VRASYGACKAPGLLSLRLGVNPPPQVLQTDGRLYHSALASHVVRRISTVGRLRSAGITPPHRSSTPLRHPLAFGPLPGASGYRTYLAPDISAWGEEGFSSCLACPCHHAVASTPPKWSSRLSQRSASPYCLRPTVGGSAFEASHFRGHLCVHFRYGLVTRASPRESGSIGSKVLVSRHPAIQATGLLTFTPAGLSPAEHASLRWTHNCS
jgi:hypothetical protein